jgi:hypothetical protein
MNLLVNGCSLTYGAEILGKNNYSLENKNYSWPIHLSEKLKVKNLTNIAVCASSNISIYRSTIKELARNEYDMCIVQWSSLYRTEVVLDTKLTKDLEKNPCPAGFVRDNYVNITSSMIAPSMKGLEKFFFDYQGIESYQTELLQCYAQSIDAVCLSKGVECYQFNGIEDIELEIQHYYKNIFCKDSNTHPSRNDHITYANSLCDYIIECQTEPSK